MIVVWIAVALLSFAFVPIGPFVVLVAVLASIATRKTDGQGAEQAIKDAETHAVVVSTVKWFLGIDPASQEAHRQRQARKFATPLVQPVAEFGGTGRFQHGRPADVTAPIIPCRMHAYCASDCDQRVSTRHFTYDADGERQPVRDNRSAPTSPTPTPTSAPETGIFRRIDR